MLMYDGLYNVIDVKSYCSRPIKYSWFCYAWHPNHLLSTWLSSKNNVLVSCSENYKIALIVAYIHNWSKSNEFRIDFDWNVSCFTCTPFNLRYFGCCLILSNTPFTLRLSLSSHVRPSPISLMIQKSTFICSTFDGTPPTAHVQIFELTDAMPF